MTSRRIGLVGGMTWHSSHWYYEQVNRLSNERLGGLSTAAVLLDSLDFGELDRLANGEGRWEPVCLRLCESARRLQAAGASCVLLCANTAHLMADAIADCVDIPLVHVGDCVAAEAARLGLKRLALLGTRHVTARPDLFGRRLGSGATCEAPEERDCWSLDGLIHEDLMHGRFGPAQARHVSRLGRALLARGADAVLLACTELSVLAQRHPLHLPCMDAGRLHVHAAVDHALEQR